MKNLHRPAVITCWITQNTTSNYNACSVVRHQERFQVKNPPHTYIQKLRGYLDPRVTRKVGQQKYIKLYLQVLWSACVCVKKCRSQVISLESVGPEFHKFKEMRMSVSEIYCWWFGREGSRSLWWSLTASSAVNQFLYCNLSPGGQKKCFSLTFGESYRPL